MDVCHLIENLPWFRNREWRSLNSRAVYSFVQDFLKEDPLFRVSKDSTDGFQSGAIYFFSPTRDGSCSIKVADLKDCSASEEGTTLLKLSDISFVELCNNVDLVNFFAIVIKYHSGDEYHHIYHLPPSDTPPQSPSDIKKAIVRELHKGASMSTVSIIKQYPIEGKEYEQYNLPALRGDESLNELAEYIGSDTDFNYDADEEVVIDGIFRELEEEVYGDVEVEDPMNNTSIVSNVVFVDENGFLVKNHEDFNYTGTLDYIPSKLNYAAAALVENKVVITPKFAVTVELDKITYDEFLTEVEKIFAKTGVAMQAFIEVHRSDAKKISLHGQLCAIELACMVEGVTVLDEELISIVQIPFTGYVLVQLGESDGAADELKRPIAFSCVMLPTKKVVKLDGPVDYLNRIPYTIMGKYDEKQLLYIYMMALDRYNCYYVYNGNIYLPTYSKKCSDNDLVPLFKELVLCFVGCGNRDRLYAALNIMCQVQDIVLPAAAYLCPIEFLKSVGGEEVMNYLTRVFKLKRPVDKGSAEVKALRKAKTMVDLLDALTSFKSEDEVYPISTIGLFASSMQDIPMFKQLAGCNDHELLSQLVQELVQIMCKKAPDSLAAVLFAHRSTLTPEQKAQAIKSIKKRI